MLAIINPRRADSRRGNTPRDPLFPSSFPYQLRGRRAEADWSTDEAMTKQRPGSSVRSLAGQSRWSPTVYRLESAELSP
jgi:hypothetical protein